jgi:hypothetical protein
VNRYVHQRRIGFDKGRILTGYRLNLTFYGANSPDWGKIVDDLKIKG